MTSSSGPVVRTASSLSSGSGLPPVPSPPADPSAPPPLCAELLYNLHYKIQQATQELSVASYRRSVASAAVTREEERVSSEASCLGVNDRRAEALQAVIGLLEGLRDGGRGPEDIGALRSEFGEEYESLGVDRIVPKFAGGRMREEMEAWEVFREPEYGPKVVERWGFGREEAVKMGE